MVERSRLIPTILITGFLGAGKTTLLQRLILHYEALRTVVLINEFGKIGIDGALLPGGNYEKVELNRGSLFCICIRTDFIAEVERIATELKPDVLLIEATGIADTSEMEKMLALPNLRDHISLKACICLVDCVNFLKIKDNLKAPVAQVRSADIVLLNKIDLVTTEQKAAVKNSLRDIAHRALQLECTHADFPLDIIDHIERPSASPGALPGDGRPDPVFSLSLENQGTITTANWQHFLSGLNGHLLRMKGIIHLDGVPTFIDGTMDSLSTSPLCSATGETNQLVIIGQQLDTGRIEQAFKALTRPS